MLRFTSSVALTLALLSPAGVGASTATADKLEQTVRVSQAAIGRTVADWRFTDHAGRPLRASELRGKPWVASFVYTGCFQVCPATTQFLKRAVRSARDALGPGRFRVVSIGFNQPFDTPQALAAFARQQGIDLADWVFVAPRTDEVDALLAEFGVKVEATAAGFDHVIQATIVDPEGRIYRQVYGDDFALPMLIGPLKELLTGQARSVVSVENIWLQVKLYCTVYDPASGRYRFNYTLFVELFVGITFLVALAAFVIRELRRRANFAAPLAAQPREPARLGGVRPPHG